MPKVTSDTNFRQNIYNKTNGFCAYCGCDISFNNFQIDHLIPKRRYKIIESSTLVRGTDELENLYPSCGSCNASKSDLSVNDFRQRVADRIDRLNSYSTEYQIAKRFGLVKEISDEVVFYFEKIQKCQESEQ